MKVSELVERLSRLAQDTEVIGGVTVQDGKGLLYNYMVSPVNILEQGEDVVIVHDVIDTNNVHHDY